MLSNKGKFTSLKYFSYVNSYNTSPWSKNIKFIFFNKLIW